MTFKDIANLLVAENFTSDLSLSKICVSLLITLLIALWIFFIYKKYAQREFYSKDFNIALALMSLITTGIILAMQSNLVISLGMVGALSIVRYRTAIKSSLDLFFMFWAISCGIVCGAEQYVLALLMSLLVSVLLFVLLKLDFSAKFYMVIIHCNKVADLKSAEKIVAENSSYFKLKSKQVNDENCEVILEYKPRKNSDLAIALSGKKYVKSFQIISNC